MLKLNGEFFCKKKKDYSEGMCSCIIDAMEKIKNIGDRPLMMLGKIQSGKTRAFIGLLSVAFDNGYDLGIVLTKNSNALAKQTVARMKDEFKEFVEEDFLDIYDIMSIPAKISRHELDKKFLLVVKKEKNNLPKLMEFISMYALHENKKCLVIDDEADFCSIGYDVNKENDSFDLKKIASQINELRLKLVCNFVQVTATPYSLYLQPDNIEIETQEIRPIKPLDTVLVPHDSSYIGGDYYFDNENNPLGEYLFEQIEEEELLILKTSDRRKFKFEESFTSTKIKGLREAIINFLVGGTIRIIQNGNSLRGKKNKFSFIIHTDISKNSHFRQEEIIDEIIFQLEEEVKKENSSVLEDVIVKAYNNIKKSVEEYKFDLPEYLEVKSKVIEGIKKEWVSRNVVNSEGDINTLLDDDGQLKLRSPLNIFIGGQILDRGITINNLIGFYYGRNPKKMQQDTVLQHSRMYGYRNEKDLSVTRFYTTRELYTRMKLIHEFDTKLREDLSNDSFKNGIIFVGKDKNDRIIPCSPDKIRISNTQVLRGEKTILPIGFQTFSKTTIKRYIDKIDTILKENNNGGIEGEYSISKKSAIEIIKYIYQTLDIEAKETCISDSAMVSLINYLNSETINIYCRSNREITRTRKTSRYYSDMPYNRDRDLKSAKEMAEVIPVLMLMKQKGLVENEWRGGEFYWPILVIPKNIPTAVYTDSILK